MLLANNVLLVAACGRFLGHVVSLFLMRWTSGKSLSAHPILTPFLSPDDARHLLMGIGPLAQWKKASLPELATRLRWAFAVSIVTALALRLSWAIGRRLVSLRSIAGNLDCDNGTRLTCVNGLPMLMGNSALGRLAGCTIVLGHAPGPLRSRPVHRRRDHGEGLRSGARRTDERRQTHDRRLHVPVDGTSNIRTNYIAARGHFCDSDGRDVTVMYPEKRRYTVQNQTMTEAAISRGLCATCMYRWVNRSNDGA